MKATTIPLKQHEREVSSLKEEIAFLKEQIEWFKKQIFGQKADKFVDLKNEQQLQFEGFDMVLTPAEEKQAVGAHERKKRKPNGQDKITLPASIPVERQFIDIPEAAKICPETGKPAKKSLPN